MNTIRLFREDVYMKEAWGQVLSVKEEQGKASLVLDRTIFFPEGGGQSCDLGTVDGHKVLHVSETEDEIIHLVECSEGTFAAGQQVQLAIDWDRRFDNMQRHCGEHILSGMFFREYGGVNRGFHMGDQYMTIDISLEADPEYTAITWDMAKHVERCTNEAIWQNQPVITRHFDTKKEAEHLPMRKALTLEKDITIVCVGDVENPSDCVFCCGTHPSTAGQVGMVKIFKVESNKGMFRIYFEAGRRAFLKYQEEMDVLNTLCTSLSAGTDDVLKKYETQIEKNKEVRTQLYLLKKDVLAKETARIIEDYSRGVKVHRYSVLSLDDLVSLTREIGPHAGKIGFLVHEPTFTVLLVSDGKTDCGKLVKDNAQIYNGKGGGNKTMARAIFTKMEYVDTFIDLIEKHLR